MSTFIAVFLIFLGTILVYESKSEQDKTILCLAILSLVLGLLMLWIK